MEICQIGAEFSMWTDGLVDVNVRVSHFAKRVCKNRTSRVILAYSVLGTSVPVSMCRCRYSLKIKSRCESDWNEMKLLLVLIQCQSAPSEFTAIV